MYHYSTHIMETVIPTPHTHSLTHSLTYTCCRYYRYCTLPVTQLSYMYAILYYTILSPHVSVCQCMSVSQCIDTDYIVSVIQFSCVCVCVCGSNAERRRKKVRFVFFFISSSLTHSLTHSLSLTSFSIVMDLTILLYRIKSVPLCRWWA
jgi:hypothetical protein